MSKLNGESAITEPPHVVVVRRADHPPTVNPPMCNHTSSLTKNIVSASQHVYTCAAATSGRTRCRRPR